MGLFSKLKKKKEADEEPVKKGVEDFMNFVRIYLQATIAANLGITNIKLMPDLAMFKRTLKIPTANNKLGVAERARARKIMQAEYGIGDIFFTELDASIKKGCKSQAAIQGYSLKIQDYLGNLLTLVTSLLKWKMQVPSFMKGTLRRMVAESINKIMTKPDWKKPEVAAASFNLRKQVASLGFSEEWMTEFMFNIIILAKKEKRKKEEV